MTEGPATLENRTFDEITVGDSASVTKTLTRDDIALFTAVSGDVNPIHLDERLAEASPLRCEVGHSLWGGGLISGLLGTRLPGPGTVCVAQDLSFLRPVGLGDTLTATMTAREKRPETKTVVFDCACTNQGGDRLIAGIAEVTAPAAKIRVPRGELPDVALRRHEAAEKAVALVRDGEAEVLMKGSLHTDELMGAVVRRETGLRTERRVSHCFIMDVPSYPKPLVVTDAAINIFPKPDRASATRRPARRIHGSPASAVMSIPPSAVGDGSAVGTSGGSLRPQRRPGRARFRDPSSRATERTR